MDFDAIRSFCLSLPGATEDVKWENDLCFCVAGKMFVVTGFSRSPVSMIVKAADEEFADLCDRVGFSPAPYLARNKWVRIEDARQLPAEELKRLLRTSYDRVVAALPKRTQREIAGGAGAAGGAKRGTAASRAGRKKK